MASYVCIIFGKGRGALTVEAFEHKDERAAVAQALATAQQNPNAYGYELWDRGRKVANYFANEPLGVVLPKTGGAAPTP